MSNEIIKKQVQKPLSQIDEVKQEFLKSKTKYVTALPKNIDPDKFFSVVITALNQNPTLLSLNRESLFNSCIKCAQDGLLPDGREAALVPFKGIVTYMPMIQGILKKIRNSGELSNINAQVVYLNDEFDYWIDESGEHLKHKPLLMGERGPVKLTYAIARTKDDAIYVEVMTEEQINEVRNVSRSKDLGPWSGPFADEMRRKTAIRRLSKRLPMSSDVQEVIESVDQFYDFKAEAEKKANSKLESLTEALNLAQAQSAPQPEQLPFMDEKDLK